MIRDFKIILFLLPVLACLAASGQTDENLFSRLQAISNAGVDFYNVDGTEITSQVINSEFSQKAILKKFRRFAIKETDLTHSDSTLPFQNYLVAKSEELFPGTIQNTSYYFIENSNKTITAITYNSVNKNDLDFQKAFNQLILKNEIPGRIFNSLQIDSINFAGRKVALGSSCRWMGINNVQCPYYGQMNWSVHKDSADASNSVTSQYNVIKAKKQGKIVSEESVDVVFEGSAIKAKRAVFDLTGLTSALAGMSGGKTLTIYFVAAPVRQHYVSCVMSFWNNDRINPSGLPPLLEKVMKLKN